MRINHNISALNTYRQLTSNSSNAQKNMEKLSSGQSINRAGDNAAGLSISEKMRGQIRGLEQASRNSQDGISLIQTAEGALTETHEILHAYVEGFRAFRLMHLQLFGLKRSHLEQASRNSQDGISSIQTAEGAVNETHEILHAYVEGFRAFRLMHLQLFGLKRSHLEQASRNSQDGISLIQTAEGALNETHEILQRMRELAVQASNDTNVTADRTAIKDELTQLKGEITRIANETEFNTQKLIATKDSYVFQVGANSGQTIKLTINKMTATALGVTSAAISVSDTTKAQSAISTINTAITKVSTERSKLGSVQNRLEHTINNLNTGAENLTAAESRIRDVDMAKEMMEFTKNNILSQAAQSMLAQANQQPQGVLQLLR